MTMTNLIEIENADFCRLAEYGTSCYRRRLTKSDTSHEMYFHNKMSQSECIKRHRRFLFK